MTRLFSVLALLVLVVGGLARPVRADEAARAEARERFDRGLRLFEEGDNAGALAEFRRAHELSPNRLVLFNIGMVYAAMNRPVEAADTLDQVLKDAGPLTPERRERARTTRDEQARRIATLAVTTNTPAAIEVDGVELGRTPDQGRLRVPGGTHVVGALAPGYLPSRREVTVAGGAVAEVSFELAPTESSLAHIELTSPVPAADVLIDGALVGRTPLPASLPVAAGSHLVELRRVGYRPARQQLQLGEGARGELHLDLEEDPATPADKKGSLRVEASEREATVTVDGRPRGVDPGPLTLAAGPHRLRVDRPGFVPVEREVLVLAGREVTARVTLPATAETRLAYVSRVRGKRRLAWATTAVGLALATAAGAAAVWGHAGLPDARAHLAAVELSFVRMGRGECDPAMFLTDQMMAICSARLSQADDDLAKRKLTRTLGLVGLGVGLAAAAAGTYLLVTGEDAGRYDRLGGADPFARARPRLLPLAWAGSHAGGAGLILSF